jgi:AcrR family transcriptional regulator
MLQAVTTTAEKAERVRLSAGDWEQGALDLLAAHGVGAVTVESLAKQLGVTKGSFYWHFPTREALLKAAFDRWEKQSTDKFIEEITPIDDPRARLRELFRRTGHEAKSHAIYASLLRALDHPMVQPVMARVTLQRTGFLIDAYRQIGMTDEMATYRARLAYAAYVGFLQLTPRVGMPRMEHDAMEAYVEHVIEALIPA